ncbi:MAG: hypothetical protein ACR2K1_08830 [Saprospiraceae bacterium]
MARKPVDIEPDDSIRTLVREGAARYSVKEQLADCAKFGAGVVYTVGKKGDTREAWVVSVRSGNTALVPRLDLIADPKGPSNYSPSQQFASDVSAILARGGVIVEALTGISSRDTAWNERFREVMRFLQKGRRGKHPRSLDGLARGTKRAIDTSTVKNWSKPHMRQHRQHYGSMWYDRVQYRTVEAAEAAINNALRDARMEEIGSWRSMYRIWGGRTGKKRKPKARG